MRCITINGLCYWVKPRTGILGVGYVLSEKRTLSSFLVRFILLVYTGVMK